MDKDMWVYAQSDPASARTMLEPLLDALQIDVFENAGGLRFQSRAQRAAPARLLDVLADREGEPLVAETRAEETALASEAIIDHFDPAKDYEGAAAHSRRLVTGNDRQHRISLPGTMEAAGAVGAADVWLRENWSVRRTLSFALSPANLALTPGDAVEMEQGPAGRFLVTHVADGLLRQVTAEGFVSAAAAAMPADRAASGDNGAGAGFSPIVDYLDLPVLKGTDEAAWAMAAAYGRPWRPLALSASATTEGYTQRLVLDTPACIGALVEPLAPGYPGRFGGGAIVVELYSGAFASAGDSAVLNGANTLAILSESGVWEIVQFAEAEEIADGRWLLSRLLRGQAGTEDAMAAGAAAGQPVVALDAAVRPLGLRQDEAGLELNWVADAPGLVTGDQPAIAFVGGIRALTPLSPVHLKAARTASGDVALSWIRRGRINADSWLGPDIPLGEAQERYRVEILDGNAVKRSAEVTTPAFTYAASDETADFGAPQPVLSVRVRQLGDRISDGLPATAVLKLSSSNPTTDQERT